ncbi:phage adaptor protein [Paenibacillus sp. FSL L8-0494]|uniref:phage adaptor protein n=1 Tax=Paenibacillus sp. FSL L8-0494 TaxID=2975352 RepID=UPI0030FC248E
MQISEIISEADLLVPNEVPTADKVMWLNALNQDFFNVVKIPRVISFTPVVDQATYTLSTEIRLKNIDLLTVGLIKYKELLPTAPNPLQNTYTFDDSTHTLTLRPAPYSSGLQGVLRYSRIATTNFTASDLSAVPEAPEEYHFSYYIGLASYIANAMDDMNKGSFYEAQYLKVWDTAARQYAGVETNG